MRALFVIAALALSQSQPGTTRGGFLRKVEYQTYAPITYFVNGEFGSDSNPCLTGDAGACATIGSVLRRIPARSCNAVTILVSGSSDGGAWTYNENLVIDGYTFCTVQDGGTAAPGIVIAAVPGQAVVSLDGGETGTLASYTAAGDPNATQVQVTLSNSTGAAELGGLFLVVTPPDGGIVKRSIIAFSDGGTGPVFLTQALQPTPLAGEAYQITSPAAVVSGVATLRNTNSAGSYTFQDIGFTRAAAGAAVIVTKGSATFTRCLIQSGTVANAAGMSVGGEASVLLSSSIIQGRSTGSTLVFAGGTKPVGGSFAGGTLVWANNGSPANQAFELQSGVGNVTGSNYQVRSDYTSSLGCAWNAFETFSGYAALPTLIVNRGTPANSIGVCIQGQNNFSPISTPFVARTEPGNNFIVSSYSVGARVWGGYLVFMAAARTMGCYQNTTTCLDIRAGGQVYFDVNGTNWTNTGVTNDITIDGVPYVYVDIFNMSPRSVRNYIGSTFTQ